MHQWQSVYENTLNALNYKLFKCYRYPVGSVRIHRSSQEDGFCDYLERCGIQIPRELTPYTVPYPLKKYLHLYVPSTI
jgi:hypothetical protein